MRKEFGVHILNEKGLGHSVEIANKFSKLLDELSQFCPEGPEMFIATGKLQEACFFAKKAMAQAKINQAGTL